MLTLTDQRAAEWARDIALGADTQEDQPDSWLATHPAFREVATGSSDGDARHDLRDLAYQHAQGVLARGDSLPDTAVRDR
jgi:hypothetical protein